MSYQSSRPLRYTPEVRAMMPRIVALFEKAGYAVSADLRDWSMSITRPGQGQQKGVIIPAGKSRQPDALLCARGVPVFTRALERDDRRLCEELAALDQEIVGVIAPSATRQHLETGSGTLFFCASRSPRP